MQSTVSITVNTPLSLSPCSSPTLRVQTLVHVNSVGEGVAQGQRCEKHLHANDEVLVAGGDRALAHRHLQGVDLRDGAARLQDGQQEACSQEGTRLIKNRQTTNKSVGSGVGVGRESSPCQKDRKMTDLTMRNLSMGL